MPLLAFYILIKMHAIIIEIGNKVGFSFKRILKKVSRSWSLLQRIRYDDFFKGRYSVSQERLLY